jgi:tetratricopeptide (TPR) repeat protein
MMQQKFRVFISSPSDVFAERERVERVILRLNGEFGGGLLEAIRWERSYYTAAKTFQDQIPLPSETDLVICILWKRLGFELPPDYRRPDGTTPTGTEYEFEDAMAAARSKGTPDVLVYRKSAPVLLNAEQVAMESAQFDALKTFWTRWFRNETGNFTAAYQNFETTDQFETEVEGHIRQWLDRHKVALSGVTWPIELRGSPFRGLQPFDAAHVDVFFGRRRAIERARERLADAAGRGTPFLLILGASGSGKSSLARAGLAPRIVQAGAVPGVDVWRRCVVRPGEGDTPLHALARALFRPESLPELVDSDSPTPLDLAALLVSAPEAAARAIRRALQRMTADLSKREGFDRPVEARLLLIVDQFEEALAANDREAFARALTAVCDGGNTWVVATLRSDLYQPFQASPALTALRDAGAQLDLLVPSAAELNDIVTGPAAAAGLRFETHADGAGLDEALVQAANQPGALPLLQLTLEALFEARDVVANMLTWAAYDELGGLAGVVERRAEATLGGLDAEAIETLPSVLRAIVAVTEEGLVASRPALLDSAAVTPAARRLVDAFVAARLLASDAQAGVTRVRVAHDALLSAWPRASDIIAAEREMLRTRGRVEAAARRWIEERRDADFLLPPGRPLAEAADLIHAPGGLDPDAAALVIASQAADDDRRSAARSRQERELRLEADAQQARADAATRIVQRTRVAAAAVSALLLLATGAAFYANGQRSLAERQTAEADRQRIVADEQTVKAEQGFQAALTGGANLVAAVDAHLGDGGMTRSVARDLLGAADKGIGGLLPSGGDAALPPALLDIDSRLQSSFSRVFVAVCEVDEARARADRAVAVAEASLNALPSGERTLALMKAEETLGIAMEAQGDWPGAGAAFGRAESRAVAPLDDASKTMVQKLRRARAYTMIGTTDSEKSIAILNEDLAWLTTRATANPNEPEILEQQAIDHRYLAIAAKDGGDFAAALRSLDSEAELLKRLAVRDPANVAWVRYMGMNAIVRSVIASKQGDAPAALAASRDASRYAGLVLSRDPGHGRWRIEALSADQRLAFDLFRAGDRAGARDVLRPAIEGIKLLTAPGSRGGLCRSEAAQIQSLIGNVLAVMGDGAEAIAILQVNLALARSLAEGKAADPGIWRGVADAELQLARVLLLADKPGEVVQHAGAGIAAMMSAGQSDDPAFEKTLRELRLLLGDAQVKSGDIHGGLSTYADDRKRAHAMMVSHPDDMSWRRALVTSWLRTAEAQSRANRQLDLWTTLQAAKAASAPVVGPEAQTPEWKNLQIDLHQWLGTAEMGRQETAAGIAQYKEALAASDALVALQPSEQRGYVMRGLTLAFLGNAYRSIGEIKEADDCVAQSKLAFAEATKVANSKAGAPP